MTTTIARHASLQDLAELLQSQQARKVDVVAPATAIRAEGGMVRVTGVEPEITEDGVTQLDGLYQPTEVFDEGVADKLRVPLTYVRRMRAERPDLWDANVNGWLHGRRRNAGGEITVIAPHDPRTFLLRCFKPTEGDGAGIARAFLSDRYGFFDHLDGLTAALDGIKQAGVPVEIVGCDLSERRMRVRVACPQVKALAPVLLGRYRNPFAGRDARTQEAMEAHGWLHEHEQDAVFAGFEISNSETGGGAFSIAPRLLVKVCSNGLVVSGDALRSVHLGSKLDSGLVRWSADTQRKQADLIVAQARDAVTTFLDVEYVQKVVADIEAKAGKAVANPQVAVETVGRKLGYTEDQIASVLGMFIAGGDLTAGGVMQAVTAAAQVETDADDAATMEADGLRALDLAAAL